jgi:DNA-binding NtrC family response regulator
VLEGDASVARALVPASASEQDGKEGSRDMEARQEEVKVLIVDDNKDFTDSLEALLKENSFDVVSAQDSSTAIEEYRKKIYQAVLLDLKMPGMSGEELLREFKRIDSDVSIIIMTAYPSIESAVATIKANAAAYLTKPFEVDECIKAIREAIAASSSRPSARSSAASARRSVRCGAARG